MKNKLVELAAAQRTPERTEIMATTPAPTADDNPPGLPGPTGRIATAVAARNQLPVDLTTGLALGVLSAATRGAWRVRLNRDWTESLALYTAGVVDTGTLAVQRDLTAPLDPAEPELVRAIADGYAEDAELREAVLSRLRDSVDEAEHGQDAAARSRAAWQVAKLGRELAQAGERHQWRLWSGDVAPESLPTALARQGGVGAYVGGSKLLDAIGHTGAPIALSVLSKAYDAGRIHVARPSRYGVDLAEPFLAIAILASPRSMAEARRDPALR
ncbi:DUF3987 domain-containing protein, partial [Parafrankia soli]|uniref:DUF3987 domain-containing protein n=1 Tax=Parafrankia soli TaxID=2599596 RepID=UPI000E2FC19D